MVLPRTSGLTPRTCYVMSFLLIAVLCCTPISTSAQTEAAKSNRTQLTQQSRMHEVVVTAAHPLSIMDMPRSVSVITADEIELSGAQSIPDLLSREANITLTSFSSNEKFSRLDFRGSGDTSVSNVLTLIDGIKINTPDLAGADFSTISMQQIERIEIVRGANSVRFGGGASHGVINIITQCPDHTQVYGKRERGSYNSDALLLSATIATKTSCLSVNSIVKQNDGYRQHNRLLTEDFLLQFRKQWGDSNKLFFKSQQHDDEYQLPGPLSRNNLANGAVDRRSGSIARGTEGITHDESQLFQLIIAPIDTVSIKSNFQYRERENLFKFSQQLANIPDAEQDRIELKTFSSDTVLHWKANTLPLTFSGGFDYSNAQYSRTNGGQFNPARTKNEGAIISRAGFFHGQLSLLKTATISLGYRRDKTDNRFKIFELKQDKSSPLCDRIEQSGVTFFLNCPYTDQLQRRQNDDWNNEAYEFGGVYFFNQQIRFYASAARTFRNPNIDELALPVLDNSNTLQDSTLRPQSANRYETGFKFDGDNIGLSIGFFKFYTYDEIVFRDTGANGGTLGNFNFEQTIQRDGFEFEIIGYLSSTLQAGLNAGYTDAATPDGKRIPLTTKINASANITWEINPFFTLHHNIRYVGERHDGNDENSTGANKLPSYQVANARMQFKHRLSGLTLYFGANNIYNKKYISTSYSNQGYPAAERSFYGGLNFEL